MEREIEHLSARVRRNNAVLFALCMAPTLISLFAFTYWPLIDAAWSSLQLEDLNHRIARFIGLSNYRELLEDPDIQRVFRNTAYYIMIVCPLSVLLGLFSALAVNGIGPLRVAARALIFHPVLLPTVAVAAIWLFLLNPVSGPFPTIAAHLFGRTPNLLSQPGSALVTVALVGVYKNSGMYMLFFLAGLQTVPRNVVEAAQIDGAGAVRVFRHVTWPLLGPVAFFVLVTAVLDSLRNVDHIFVLTEGGPANGTNVLLYQIYLEGFEFWNTGKASALTIMLAALLILIAIIALPRLERGVHYEA